MTKEKPDADTAWKIYNFVTAYKNGDCGLVTLQEAIDNYYK